MNKQDHIQEAMSCCKAQGLDVCWCSQPEVLRSYERFTLDSRDCNDNVAFLALKGEKLDGNDFITASLLAGAPLVVCTTEPASELCELAKQHGAALLYCSDGTVFLQELARVYREHLSCLCVGITGSVGKTTTKEMAKVVCETRYKTHASSGNFNNELGLPLSLLAAPEDCELLILEMGMSSRGEIKRLTEIAHPQIGIITNVGVSHLGKLGSRDNIARAKAELIEGLCDFDEGLVRKFTLPDKHPYLILHEEDDYFDWMKQYYLEGSEIHLRSHVRKYAQEHLSLDILSRPSFDYVPGTQQADSQFNTEPCRVSLSVPGEHNIINAQAILCLAELVGIELEEAASALSRKLPSASRQDIIDCRGIVLIDDSYNANPVSMIGAIKALACMKNSGKKYVILGDMGELGEAEVELHASVGEALMQECAGFSIPLESICLCCIGKLATHIAQRAKELGMPESSILVCTSYEQSKDRLAALAQQMQAGDIVLVKASRAASLERVVKGIQELVW